MGESAIDLSGLAIELERDEVVRDHLRQEHAKLFDKEKDVECIKTCATDIPNRVIGYLCIRMASAPSMPQPPVAELRIELEKLYKRCGKPVDESTIYDDAWIIRKLCCFVKMKTRKKKVSTVTCLCLDSWVINGELDSCD